MRFELLSIVALRSGLSTLLAQNTILMGVFFTIPLYLQIVLGFDALETGIKMLPTSVVMFVVAFSGALLLKVLSPRSIIRIGLGLLTITCLVLMGTIEPDLSGTTFALGMALLGAGMGLLASQLGNVVLSSVDTESRSEAGGLQYTAQQLGSSIGVALIGSIVLTALGSIYLNEIADTDAVTDETVEAVEVALASGSSFVPADQVQASAQAAGLGEAEVTALVEHYESSQLQALKAGLLAVAAIAALAFLVTGGLPADKPSGRASEPDEDAAARPTSATGALAG